MHVRGSQYKPCGHWSLWCVKISSTTQSQFPIWLEVEVSQANAGVNDVAHMKMRMVNTQELFTDIIGGNIFLYDNLFQKSKRTKLHVDKVLFWTATYDVQKLRTNSNSKFNLEKRLGNVKNLGKSRKKSYIYSTRSWTVSLILFGEITLINLNRLELQKRLKVVAWI